MDEAEGPMLGAQIINITSRHPHHLLRAQARALLEEGDKGIRSALDLTQETGRPLHCIVPGTAPDPAWDTSTGLITQSLATNDEGVWWWKAETPRESLEHYWWCVPKVTSSSSVRSSSQDTLNIKAKVMWSTSIGTTDRKITSSVSWNLPKNVTKWGKVFTTSLNFRG